jgi:excisionase family DNA binding protein
MISIAEAALRAGRNPETIRRWIRTGHLRSERIGTQHLVDENALAGLLDNEPIDLPPEWTTATDGSAIPPWERLVRDARLTHWECCWCLIRRVRKWQVDGAVSGENVGERPGRPH